MKFLMQVAFDGDLFVSNTLAVDVVSKVENPTPASISIGDLHIDEWFDNLFDDLNNHVFDKWVLELEVVLNLRG